MARNPPPTYLDALSLHRHLDAPVFLDRTALRNVLREVRAAPSASCYFLPKHCMTVGEFCAVRLVKKWKITEPKGDGKGDGGV